MKSLNLDYINLFLIIVAFFTAITLPFKLFLLAYAILGPLHYFTEINWIRDKNYFVNSKSWQYLVIIAAVLIALPTIYKFDSLKVITEIGIVKSTITTISKYSNIIYFLILIFAGALLSTKNKKKQLVIILCGFLIGTLLHNFPLYNVIIGILLPTIIHVYLFTIIFMLYGNLKTKTKIGYINIIILLAIPIIINLITINNSNFLFSDQIKTIYTSNNFHVLNANISKLIGASDGTKFFFYEISDLKIQIFISFAYTYHYLNWFSKTTIIGWHKKLTQKKSILITLLWLISISLYFYNYKIGLSVLLFFSLLHVLFEFPLNIISAKSIFKTLIK